MAKTLGRFERHVGFYALIFCLIFAFSVWPALKSLLLPTSSVKSQAIGTKREALSCRKPLGGGDYCEIEGDIRVEAKTSTIYVLTDSDHDEIISSSWNVKPYVRGIAQRVKNWTIETVSYNDIDKYDIPKCTQSFKNPAMLFSAGGNYGNYYHSFSDLLFPLYMTSNKFQRNVDFLAGDYHDWWIHKFRGVLGMLTKRPVVDIDSEKEQVRCYRRMVVGLKFYLDLLADEYATGVSIHGFRQLLRDSYSLKRNLAMESGRTRPRLMIVSRKTTRVIVNEGEMIRAAKEMGFEVVLAKEDDAEDMSRFTQIVNSCDAIVGIHGAGLANLLFLPDNAVLIQLVPFGKLGFLAKNYFSSPVSKMKIKYLEYEVSVKESSLTQIYSDDDPVIKDPFTIHEKGWDMINSVYLQNQNFTVDIGRFKGTLVKAMELLLHQ